VVQSQEPTCSQAKGNQPIDAPSNEPQQLVMVGLPFHQIPADQEERKESQVPSTNQILTPQ
jgi:hypothetical protein